MAYRRFNRSTARQQPRNMTVRYAGLCACCGAEIKAGEYATYYPAGTLGAGRAAAIAHIGGLEGNSNACTGKLRERLDVNDYAGDGLDMRWEDAGAEICGR